MDGHCIQLNFWTCSKWRRCRNRYSWHTRSNCPKCYYEYDAARIPNANNLRAIITNYYNCLLIWYRQCNLQYYLHYHDENVCWLSCPPLLKFHLFQLQQCSQHNRRPDKYLSLQRYLQPSVLLRLHQYHKHQFIWFWDHDVWFKLRSQLCNG